MNPALSDRAAASFDFNCGNLPANKARKLDPIEALQSGMMLYVII
jgi:hypothetical protein